MRRAVFLDRDGTIIEDTGYISDPKNIRFLPQAAESLKQLRSAGFELVIITNQAGIGRGLLTEQQYRLVNASMLEQLTDTGVTIRACYFCPHAPGDGCGCRKPLPGMLTRAAQELQLDLSRSWMIGDKFTDIQAGSAAGCQTILLNRKDSAENRSLSASVNPDIECPDWTGLCSLLLSSKVNREQHSAPGF